MSQRLPRSRPQTDFVIPYLHNLVQIPLCGFGRIRFLFFALERGYRSWHGDKEGTWCLTGLGFRASKPSKMKLLCYVRNLGGGTSMPLPPRVVSRSLPELRIPMLAGQTGVKEGPA